MAIKFLYSRRESLTGKAEVYKKSVRAYLESMGFSQTTDSFVEGTLEDMVFFNPTIAPGREFVIEAKAERPRLRSKRFATELTNYFKLWHRLTPDRRFMFMLFLQGVGDKPQLWEKIFSKDGNMQAVMDWCDWYNEKCRDTSEPRLECGDTSEFVNFLAETEVIVGDRMQLETAVSEKESTSASSISRMAGKLLRISQKRKAPVMRKSFLVMNILPITLPDSYHICKSTAQSKREIYDTLQGKIIPPFIWRRGGYMMSFAGFDDYNPLSEFADGPVSEMRTKELQISNPNLSSHLVNIHLRRIIWNRGVYRDGETFYFPMLDKSAQERLEIGPSGRRRWVTKKLVHSKDTQSARKGDVNFYFHRAVELRSPTYWGFTYLEMIPRKYFTLDGETPIEGEIRARMDARFRNPMYDRSRTRMRLMKFWKYALFDSGEFTIPPEGWFSTFRFEDFVTERVAWSPEVIGRTQTRLWDFGGAA